jgi:DNA-binding CsgD family transcriptional regulator
VAARLATLSARERQVMDRVVVGQATRTLLPTCNQRRTVDHRHSVMRKIGATRRVGAVGRCTSRARAGSAPRQVWRARRQYRPPWWLTVAHSYYY